MNCIFQSIFALLFASLLLSIGNPAHADQFEESSFLISNVLIIDGTGNRPGNVIRRIQI